MFTGCTVGVGYLHGLQWERDVYRVYSRSRVFTWCTVGVGCIQDCTVGVGCLHDVQRD